MNVSPLLLDSNIVVWLDQKPNRIPASVLEQIRTSPRVYVSAVTSWELGIKQSAGGLTLTRPVSEFVRSEQMVELPITIEHGEAVLSLPLHHRDPFDRLLVAQALAEGLTLVTSDRMLAQYSVPVLLV
jgi:PIN domain nuclease of toxin-antitoxin system